MEAIARLGAAECLRSGITTVGDLAFAGASAAACADLGLRAIVYLEVFGRDPADAMRQFEEKREYVAGALSERVQVGVSPHAPVHLLDRGVRSVPRPRPSGRDPPERERRRARLAAPRRGAVAAARRDARRAGRPQRDQAARGGAAARRAGRRRTLRQGRRGGDRTARPARRRGRPLPALERAPRLRDRSARRAARGRPPCRRRHRRRLVRAVARLLRGAANGDLAGAGARRARRLALGRRTRSSSRRSAARRLSGWTQRRARSSPASGRMSLCSRFPARRIYHGRTRQQPSSTVGLRNAS